MQSARILFKNCLFRFYSSKSSHILEQLKCRSLVRVCGEDSSTLLQGLITNDMQHLSKPGNLFAMFLNNKGRVLFDTIIYRINSATNSENIFYLEVDKEARDQLIKHLNIYRLRRKIDVSSIDDELKIWTKFNPELVNSKKIDGEIYVPCSGPHGDTLSDNNVTVRKVADREILIFRDPRISVLGVRILAPADFETELFNLFDIEAEKNSFYKSFRYQLGVGEGIEELPPGNCFPLEANCDYLHGVSFHKGCYIGQELTARTHHTGVIRKRLMPLILKRKNHNFAPAKDEVIKCGDKSVGKLRGFENDTGLGLLRIEQVLDKELKIYNTEAVTYKPYWWSKEISKERITASKY